MNIKLHMNNVADRCRIKNDIEYNAISFSKFDVCINQLSKMTYYLQDTYQIQKLGTK